VDESLMQALKALKDAAAAGDESSQQAARQRVARLAYPTLAAAAASARRTTRATLVEDAVQNAVLEFIEKKPEKLVVATAPGLLRTIFRCRLKDQRRRDGRYVFHAE